jgi:hypothetical protein
MRYYWIQFSDRKRGCIDAENETEALELAAKHGEGPEIVGTLPYPGEPRLEKRSRCPSFCLHPDQCVGRGSCPRLTRSCSS